MGAFGQFPSMIAGMTLGTLANLVVVEYFHLPKILLLIGLMPSAFAGGIIALYVFHWWNNRNNQKS